MYNPFSTEQRQTERQRQRHGEGGTARSFEAQKRFYYFPKTFWRFPTVLWMKSKVLYQDPLQLERKLNVCQGRLVSASQTLLPAPLCSQCCSHAVFLPLKLTQHTPASAGQHVPPTSLSIAPAFRSIPSSINIFWMTHYLLIQHRRKVLNCFHNNTRVHWSWTKVTRKCIQ